MHTDLVAYSGKSVKDQRTKEERNNDERRKHISHSRLNAYVVPRSM
jgi:hypothetical protein